MDSARLLTAESIFNDLVDQTPDRREAQIAARCGPDHELRKLVERLLASDRSGMGRFLRQPAFSPSGGDSSTAEPPLPSRIGRYEIVRRIGQGGMGVVYEARQVSPRRTVAIKVLRSALPSRAMLERFRHEADILAQLRHPGLAQVYEADVIDVTLPGGVKTEQPYFVMEFVDGRPLCEYARAAGLPPRDRLELIARVCDAVQHAHEKGVIHRDLKPENILVSDEATERRSDEGQERRVAARPFVASSLRRFVASPKILDFGVARLIGPAALTVTTQTRAGEIVGTLAYMSPEQVAGDSASVDTRSDVYSLGVIAYELLAGRLPHDVREVPLIEAARRIREEPAAPLSTFSRAFRGDIETIVARAMHPDRTRRYESAAALAADIRRCLCGDAVEARRDSAVYMLGKTLRRYRWGVAAALIFVAGLTGFAWYAADAAERNLRLAGRERDARQEAEAAEQAAEQARHAESRQRELAEIEAGHAQSVTRYLVEMLDLADPDVTQRSDLTVRQVLERASAELDGKFDQRPEAEATLRTVIGRAYAALGEPETARRHLERALLLREKRLASSPAELYEVMWPLTYVLSDLSDTLAHHRAGKCDKVGRQVLAQTLPELAARCGELAPLMNYKYPAEQAEAARARVLETASGSLSAGDPRWILLGDQFYFCGVFLAPRQHPGPACEYLQQALDIYRRALPETNTRIVRALAQLLTAQIAAGRDAEAEAVAEESLALVRQTLPSDHWYVALCSARLGGCLIGQGRYAEAEPLLLDGYEEVVAARGPAGRHASEILRSLVRLYDADGRTELAEQHRTALAAALAGSPEYASWVTSDNWTMSIRTAFGPRRPELEASLETLRAELAAGKPSAADAIAATLALRKSLLPDDHPLTAVIAEIVVRWLAYDTSSKAPKEAVLDLTRETVAAARACPELHPRKRAYILAQAGIQFRKQSELVEAESHIREALAILERGHGTYAFTDWTRAHLGVVLAMQKRFEEAEPPLLSGYQGLLDYGGPTTADTRGALRHLLLLYLNTGRPDQYVLHATADARNLLAVPEADAADLSGAAWRIARYPDLPRESYDVALPLAQRAVESLPDADGAHRALGAALYRVGRYAEALAAMQQADALAAKSRGGRLVGDLAFIAMTQHRLGSAAQAAEALSIARELVEQPRQDSPANHGFVREAERVLGSAS